jgi:ribonucleoside-diphosphate reductase alpha chain
VKNEKGHHLMTTTIGPQNAFCDALHAEKYRSPGESFREACSRVANVLTDNDADFHIFREILLTQRFLPGGRIQSAIGSTRATTPHNCYVSGTIADSFVEGSASIMNRAKEAAATMRMGGGIGYDFSTLRPRGALIKKLQSNSSGPIAFMDIFDAVCRATASSGHRRGAQMGVLRIDHPDVEEFIRAKQNSNKLTGFNISLAVTNEFMWAVIEDKNFNLKWSDVVYRTVKARDLWNMVMRSTYDWAEPGILFIDTINRENNLYYCETIAATNPCGEQPLPPYGACLLGSFNLVSYLTGVAGKWSFDYNQFIVDIPKVVEAIDNVIDYGRYPLQEQEDEAHNKRRMGLGVTGVANCIEALGFPYGSLGFRSTLENILSTLANEAYTASSLLAKKKGSFPLYDKEKFLAGKFINGLKEQTYKAIAANGLRNSHLLSIAPTGTISMAADNVSSGIEPVFSYTQERIVIGPNGPETQIIDDYGFKYLGVKGKRTTDCTALEHLNVLIAAQRWVDSSISKTCNLPKDYPYEDFKNIYLTAWKNGCKGCTTYRAGGMRAGILSSRDVESEPLSSCERDPVTGVQNCE